MWFSGVLMSRGLRTHVRSILEGSIVEAAAWEARDLRVHPVLRGQHRDALPADLQPLEERLLVVVLHRVLGEDGGGQLVGVADEDEAPARVPGRGVKGQGQGGGDGAMGR